MNMDNLTNLNASIASSVEELKIEANKNNAEAQYFLSLVYGDNNSGMYDSERSFFWMKKAAENGFEVAYEALAGMLVVREEYDEALTYIKKALDAGFESSKEKFVVMIKNLKDVDKSDITRAISYCDELIANTSDEFDIEKYKGYKNSLKYYLKSVNREDFNDYVWLSISVVMQTVFVIVMSMLVGVVRVDDYGATDKFAVLMYNLYVGLKDRVFLGYNMNILLLWILFVSMVINRLTRGHFYRNGDIKPNIISKIVFWLILIFQMAYTYYGSGKFGEDFIIAPLFLVVGTVAGRIIEKIILKFKYLFILE